MSNKQLPADVQERIKADAARVAESLPVKTDGDILVRVGYEDGYIAGATAEHDRAQVLVDFIQEIIDFPPAQSKSAMSEWIDKYREESRITLEQWKGKEVGDE